MKNIGARIYPYLNKGVTKFSSNVLVKTIASGMARLLPITVVGSIGSLFESLPIKPWQNFLVNTGLDGVLKLSSYMTNDIITIYLVAVLAYDMASFYKKDKINAILSSILAFFILTPIGQYTAKGGEDVTGFALQYLGSQGMFLGMFAALLGTRLYIYFMDHGFKVRMPDGVPPAISASFESLFAITYVGLIFMGISFIFSKTPYSDMNNFIYTILQRPLQGANNSLATMLIIVLIGEGFWWFGIHGSNVTSAITSTLYMPLAIANAKALAMGLPMEHILNSYFLNTYKGPRHFTLALMLVMLSRSKQMKSVGKVAIVPGIFNISEPLKFGIPMVFNPWVLIPMCLSPVICIIEAYFATKIGFLPIAGISLPTLPVFVSGFLEGGVAGLIVQIIQFISCFLLWFPFFKQIDKLKLQEEVSNNG